MVEDEIFDYQNLGIGREHVSVEGEIKVITEMMPEKITMVNRVMEKVVKRAIKNDIAHFNEFMNITLS